VRDGWKSEEEYGKMFLEGGRVSQTFSRFYSQSNTKKVNGVAK
jgi:hypothetical protein